MEHKLTCARFRNNPLIISSNKGLEGENINGSSIIRIPEWVKNPLGRYYMYFAHHKGEFIRLAYSDNIEGPWKVYKEGTLSIDETPGSDHIASPDVHVHKMEKKILMYYHTKYKSTGPFGNHLQVTFLAKSDDGINFTSEKEVLGPFYMRVFEYKGKYYAIAKHNDSGVLLSSTHYNKEFCIMQEIIPRMRHCAVQMKGNKLYVFFTRIEDAPESIFYCSFNIDQHPNDWQPEEPELLIKPEHDYEGAYANIFPSETGPIYELANQIRDPAVLEENNETFLFYTVSGEKGIAASRLILKD